MSNVFYATLYSVGNFLKFLLYILQLPEYSILVVFHFILNVWNEQDMWAAQYSKKETVQFKMNSEGSAVNKRTRAVYEEAKLCRCAGRAHRRLKL